MAEQTPECAEPHLLYITSLLQDIGYTVRLCSESDKYHRFHSLSTKVEADEFNIEKNIFSVTHEKIGADILAHWNFPEKITNAITKHHVLHAGDDTFLQLLQIATVLATPEKNIRHDVSLDEKIEEWKKKISEVIPPKDEPTE